MDMKNFLDSFFQDSDAALAQDVASTTEPQTPEQTGATVSSDTPDTQIQNTQEDVMEDYARYDELRPLPEPEPTPLPETVVNDQVAPPDVKPYTKGGMRYQLVFEGVCTSCAHCGLKLTDSESIERGLGPICSKKGYAEEVEPKDDTEAMLALAEYPELVDYLVRKYKPKGNRALVNGLVRTASLNRRTPVHAACTDAIDALGYKRLASALRESIAVVEMFDVAEKPDEYAVWIKKSDWSWSFYSSLRHNSGVYMTKYPQKATMVPKRHRVPLAKLLVEHYNGLYLKTPRGTFKIGPEWLGKAAAPANA